MAIADNEATSIAELVTKVLQARTGLPEHTALWFRGISCPLYGLLPSLLREGKAVDVVLEREKRLLTRFRQRSIAYWPSGYPQNEWEHMFAMQHFGLPTRLLDWTENVFVAAYFALFDSHVHKGDQPCFPVIWKKDNGVRPQHSTSNHCRA